MFQVVAVDKNWGIGNDGNLLFHISEDLKNFRRLTEGKTVILGRKTLATFPKGAPLKNRRNVILSRDESYSVEGAEVARSVEEAAELLKNENTDNVVVIGGESIYRQMLPLCDTAIVTKIDAEAPASDKFFPNLDEDENWYLAEESEVKEENGIKFKFCTYKRK
ncbi:MAG: dihydrofolate reductase [Ruminococcaceae bacterium]|nr:dihydrofolate reductase [Oscillospiraceae bacterium]